MLVLMDELLEHLSQIELRLFRQCSGRVARLAISSIFQRSEIPGSVPRLAGSDAFRHGSVAKGQADSRLDDGSSPYVISATAANARWEA